MVINAELRLPWYFCYQENDSEEIYHYAREKVKNDIEMFDKYFEDEYNIDGMYNYFTNNEIIDYYRSNGGWKSLLNKNAYNEWIIHIHNVVIGAGILRGLCVVIIYLKKH